MLKWMSVPVLAAMLAMGGTSDASAATGYATGDVNMRTGPGTRYARILTVPRGARVEIYGCSGSWCDTWYAGRRGWVSGRYLSTAYAGHYRGVSPGAAVAGIVGLGIAGAILADRYDDRYYRRHYRHRYYDRRYRWRRDRHGRLYRSYPRNWRGAPQYGFGQR